MTWDEKFLDVAHHIASWSHDPDRKVGCIMADDDHTQLSGGYNGFPRGVADDLRLADNTIKLRIVVHAEANAVAAAARNGHSLRGATAYITSHPCCQCASLMIQAGVKRIVVPAGFKLENPNSKWVADHELAKSILAEAGVIIEAL